MQPKFTLKKRGYFIKLPLKLLILFCLLSAGKTNAQPCNWTASTVSPINILDQANVTVGTNMYQFAGVSNGAIVANSYRFDGATWTPIAPTPQALEFPAAVTDGTNIYVMGGANTSGTPTTVLYRYNIATNNYTTLASYSVGTWNHAAVYLSGKIYKFAGTGPGTGSTNALEIYDIGTNTWSAGAPYPLSISFVSAYTEGGFIYAAGGIQSVGSLASLKAYRYDPATNSWNDAAMADLPATRWGAASGFYNGKFVMAGGYVGGSATANISTSALTYEAVANSWTALPNMLGERARFNGAPHTINYHAIGGRSIASSGFNGTNINQMLFCVPATPCTGTPAPGNTVASANPVCPTANFTLSPQNATSGSGVTYQWQSSPDGTTWTNIPGGTSSIFTTSQTVATYYRVQVTCSGNTGTSTPLQVTMAPVTSCYCIPTYSNGCTLGDYIARVRFRTIDNTTTCSTPPFTYYSAIPPASVVQGGTYPLTVNVGPDIFGQHVMVWIDFNINGSFADPGEFIGGSGNVGANGVANMSVTIPLTASLGQTRMRIRGGDDVAATAAQSCGPSNSTFGEAEDYNILINPCITGAITSQPANTSTMCSGSATFTVGHSGSEIAYRWEFRPNAATPWALLSNGGVFSGVNTSTLTLSNVPSTMNGYQFRAALEGPCTAPEVSAPATLTVTPLVATVAPPSATICTGTIQQLTLTNATFPATATFNATGMPVNVPDNNPTGVANTIVASGIPAGAVVTNVSVTINMTHTWVGDMVFNLTAPNGQTINLVGLLDNATGSNGTDNFTGTVISSTGTVPLSGAPAPRTGTFRADLYTATIPTIAPTTTNSWNPLIAGAMNGNWRLAMCDVGPADLGVLTSWSVSITYGAAAAGVWTGPAGTMWINSAATVPYVPGSLQNTIWVNPTVSTTYQVVYSTSTPCTSAPTNIPITVIDPVTNVVHPTNKSACVGGSTTFTASATGGPFVWVWEVSTDGGATWNTVPGATTGTLTINNITQTMNNYRYRARISAPPCAGTVTTNVAMLTVNPLPTVTVSASQLGITPGQTSTLTVTSSPAPGSPANIVWYYNGTPITGATTNTITVGIDELGTYQARLTDVNGCTNLSNEVVIGATASDKLWIYPNPTDGQFLVRLYYDGPYTDIRWIHIFNEKGQLVMKKAFDLYPTQPPYMQMSFDMTRFPAGTYVVKVEERFTGKIKSGLLIIQ